MEIALLGDSILDNGAYVSGGRDVTAHLREFVPTGVGIELLARDGAFINSVGSQLSRARTNPSHIVVSVGGNDALGAMDLLTRRAGTVAEALDQLSAAAGAFRRNYDGMLSAVSGAGRSIAVCTIYYPQFDEVMLQERAVAALTHFNDAIILAASGAALPILDLRQVCTTPGDYANPIEPSDQGGRRIAESIARMLKGHDFARGGCRIYV